MRGYASRVEEVTYVPWRGSPRFVPRRCLDAHNGRQIDAQSNTSAGYLQRMLYLLKLTRETESRIELVLYRQGKIVGGVYTSRGQEAIGVGSAVQLVEGDVVLPSHRDFHLM